jgi:endonuclease/exonuclease/phosphatase family metal-dependent hydrolase
MQRHTLAALFVLAVWAAGALAADPIRVMTFNIRYGTASDGENAWPKRQELVLETIQKFNPDLLGTQEVLAFQADYLSEHLKEYGFVGVGRDDGKRAGEMSAIWFRTTRFKPLDSGTFWLSETPETIGSKSWDAALPRVATWAKLRDLQSKKDVVFLNTHWDHVGKKAREEAGKIIHTWMGEDAANLPTIITGDFNVTEDHPGLAALMSSSSDSLKFYDVYRRLHPEANEYEASFGGFTGRTKGKRIDFILASPAFSPLEATIDRSHKDGRYPSDHYPVTAVLEYKGK